MSNFKEGWYLIYTKPRHEKKVQLQLAEMNIKSFLPTKKKLRTSHELKKYVDEPLFPSYIFIYLSDIQNYYQGIDAEGSLYYVRTGKEAARVNESIINSIRLAVSEAKEIEVSGNRFQPGKKLVICKGALTGLACEVVQFNNKRQLLLRLDLLQRNLLLTLPEEYLMDMQQSSCALSSC